MTEMLSYLAAACAEKKFFGLPVWYHYLNDGTKMQDVGGRCEFVAGFSFPEDLALVGLGVLDIVLRLAG